MMMIRQSHGRWAMPILLPLIIISILFVASPQNTWAQAKSGRASSVQVDMVRPAGDIVENRQFVAHFRSAWTGRVATRIAGSVDRLHISVGDRVSKGDLLVSLSREARQNDVAARKADLAEVRSAYAAARSALELAETELKRLQALKGSSAFRQQSYDEKKIGIAGLKADLAKAQAVIEQNKVALDQANLSLTWANIEAPFDGVVTAIETSPGDFVSAGAAVVHVQAINGMDIEADVPSADLPLLSIGMMMDVERSSGRYADLARLKSIMPLENALSRTVPVRLEITADQLSQTPRVGEAVILHARISAPKDQASLHKDAILWSNKGAQVYKVVDGKAQPVTVTLGSAIGDRFLVLDGVQSGDWLITRGNERLRPGAAVQSPDLPAGNAE